MRFGYPFAALCLAASSLTNAAHAQDSYPVRPVRILVGFPPGGPTDVAARILAEGLQKALKQTFIVENRTGASGGIGAQYVAKATPDGYTLLVAANALTLNALTTPNAGYDPDKDFVPIALMATQANAVVIHPGLPVKNLEDLRQLAKKGGLSFATSGQGTSSQVIGMYLFNALWKSDMAAVPYRGAGPADIAVASGEPPVGFTTVGGAYNMQQAGRMKILALGNDKRMPILPDVPTMGELGYDNFSASWTVLFAPVGTPAPLVEKLNTTVTQLLKDPAMRQKFAVQSMDVATPLNPKEVVAYMQRESATWKKLVDATGAAVK